MENFDGEFIKHLEDSILLLNNKKEMLQTEMNVLDDKIETINNCLNLYKQNIGYSGEKIKTKVGVIKTPGYPIDANLLEKFRFLEEKHRRVWKLKAMCDMIIEEEGKRKSRKTLLNLKKRLQVLENSGNFITLNYNNVKRYTFYCTREDWFEKVVVNEESKPAIKADYRPASIDLPPSIEPDKIVITGLSQNFLNN